MARSKGSRSGKTLHRGDRVKLATLLGAQSKHAVGSGPRGRASREVTHWRLRLLLVSGLLLALGLWGIWNEFS